MKKIKKIVCVIIAVSVLFCAFSFHVGAVGEPELKTPSAILIDQNTGEILYEKNADEQRPIASVTKVMTMLLTMEAIDSGDLSYDDMLTCSEYAASMGGSQIWMEPGEQLSVRDLLKAVAVVSANDCCVVLAEHLAGSEEGFVEKMNERAANLGMTGTHFSNTNGLSDENHYSTARDVAVMSRELLSHKDITQFTTIWMDTLRNGESGLTNTNRMIRFYEGATGLKTGFTNAAMHCLSASAERNGLQLIAVVLGAPSSNDRFGDARKLLDYGFANYKRYTPTVELPVMPVERGIEPEVELYLEGNLSVLLPKTSGDPELLVELPNNVSAPVEIGQTIGNVSLVLGDKTIATCRVLAKKTVEKQGFGWTLRKVLKNIFFGE